MEAVCTRALVISSGRMVFDGTPAEFESQAPAEVQSNRMDWVFRQLTNPEQGVTQ